MTFIEQLIYRIVHLLPRGGGFLLNHLDCLYRQHRKKRTTVGPFSVSLNPKIRLERGMFYHQYEKALIRFALSLLNPGDTAIDVGAHLGWLSLHFLNRVGPTGHVHSFEPVPELFQRLSEAFRAAKGLGYHVIANPIALGERNETATMSVGNQVNPGFNTLINNFSRDGLRDRFIQVSIRPLDEYLDEKRIHHVKLLKIDVEGAEGYVLRGARKHLEEYAFDYMLIEISPEAEEVSGRKRGETIEYLRSLGYQGYLLEGRRPKPLPRTYDFWVANTFWVSPRVQQK